MSKVNYLLDFFLPRLCSSCRKKLNPKEVVVCDDCYYKLEIPSSDYLDSEYKNKFAPKNYVDDFRAGFIFEQEKPIQFLIHSVKYDKKFAAGIYLGRLLADIFSEHIKSWNADLIIPIPLHRLKKLGRGYNQSEFIAKGVAKELKIPVSKRLVKRVKYTETQTHLNMIQRKENVKNAFRTVSQNKLAGKKIILVDDVITTGSTVSECAYVIKQAGAEKVYGLFTAIASH